MKEYFSRYKFFVLTIDYLVVPTRIRIHHPFIDLLSNKRCIFVVTNISSHRTISDHLID